MLAKRVVIILHLSIVFSIALWYLSTPYLYDLYQIRKRTAQTEFIMGSQSGMFKQLDDKEQKNILEKNARYFHSLPQKKQAQIKSHLDALHVNTKANFYEKFNQVMANIAKDSVFFLAWMILSVAISILYLKQRQGSHALLYLMPLLTFFYIGDIYLQNIHRHRSEEEMLIPSEEYLVNNYLQKEKGGEGLKAAWKKYLAKEWADESVPDKEKESFGTFQFQLAKFEAYLKDLKSDHIKSTGPGALLLFFWNLFVAIYCSTGKNRKTKCQKVKAASYNQCGS